MNKQAQVGIVGFAIIYLTGILAYAVFSGYIGEQAQMAIDNIPNMSGTEQFFLANIHFWIILGFVIVALAYGAFFFATGGST